MRGLEHAQPPERHERVGLGVHGLLDAEHTPAEVRREIAEAAGEFAQWAVGLRAADERVLLHVERVVAPESRRAHVDVEVVHPILGHGDIRLIPGRHAAGRFHVAGDRLRWHGIHGGIVHRLSIPATASTIALNFG